MRRLAAAGIAVLALTLGAGSAIGAGMGAGAETLPVDFVLSSATCPNLPGGTTVVGSGTEKSITNERTDRNGVTTVINSTHANGTATDQNGNSYVFNYSNEFRVTNSLANPGVFSGFMSDHFSLGGPGPAKLSNGFTAAISTDFVTFFTFEERNSRGDPIDFATGAALCDPL
jgi:hypothetical protein